MTKQKKCKQPVLHRMCEYGRNPAFNCVCDGECPHNATKFTPGPWNIKSYRGMHGPNKPYVTYHVVPKKYHGFGDGTIVKTENEQDARLIATAPEMYALLKEAIEHIDEWNFPIDLGDRIREVLGRVEGGIMNNKQQQILNSIPWDASSFKEASTIFWFKTTKETIVLSEIMQHRKPEICCSCRWGGSRTFPAELVPWFAGKEVVIFEDGNDDAGRKYARMEATAIYRTAKNVRIVSFKGKPEKYNIIDWIKEREKKT